MQNKGLNLKLITAATVVSRVPKTPRNCKMPLHFDIPMQQLCLETVSRTLMTTEFVRILRKLHVVENMLAAGSQQVRLIDDATNSRR